MASISSQGSQASCTRTPPATMPPFSNAQPTEGHSLFSPITSCRSQLSSSPASAFASSASYPGAPDPTCTSSCPECDATKVHPAGATLNPRNAAAASPGPALRTPFLTKTYELVDDPDTDSVISWSGDGTSFVVWSPHDLCRHMLPCNFKHGNFSSFIRQLNTYGFCKTARDRWEFAHAEFQRGQWHHLQGIHRWRSDHSCSSSAMSFSGRAGNARVEAELESLKKEKNVMRREILSLQQKLQSTAEDLNTMWERLQRAETYQRHMISFVTKAMHNPDFLAQFQQRSSVRSAASVAQHSFEPGRRWWPRDIDQPAMSSIDNCTGRPCKQKRPLAVKSGIGGHTAAPAQISAVHCHHATPVDGSRPLSHHQVFGEYYAAHHTSKPAVLQVDAGNGGLNVGDTCSTYATAVDSINDGANSSAQKNHNGPAPPQQEAFDALSSSAGMEKLTKLQRRTT